MEGCMKNNKKIIMMILGLLGLSTLSQKLISSGKRTEELARLFGPTKKSEKERQALSSGFVPSGNTKKLAEKFEKGADQKSVSSIPNLDELKEAAAQRKRISGEIKQLEKQIKIKEQRKKLEKDDGLKAVAVIEEPFKKTTEEQFVRDVNIQHAKDLLFDEKLIGVKSLMEKVDADNSGIRRGGDIVVDVLVNLPVHIEQLKPYETDPEFEDAILYEPRLKDIFRRDKRAVDLAKNVLVVLKGLNGDDKKAVLKQVAIDNYGYKGL